MIRGLAQLGCYCDDFIKIIWNQTRMLKGELKRKRKEVLINSKVWQLITFGDKGSKDDQR